MLVAHWVRPSEAMEPFKTRPFHLTGRTKDEVTGLKREYEHGPRGRKYVGDVGVVDAAALPLDGMRTHVFTMQQRTDFIDQMHCESLSERALTSFDKCNAVHTGEHDPHHVDPKKSPERSKFSQALNDFKSSFGAHEEFGECCPISHFHGTPTRYYTAAAAWCDNCLMACVYSRCPGGGAGSMPVLGYQKPFKDTWNDKKMTKLIHDAPQGKKG
jgi:hypothetical protein